LVSGDEREAVIPFAAHGLNHRGAHARRLGKQFIETAHLLDAGIIAGGVNHRSIPHDVIGDNQATAKGELERPREVIRMAWLVGVVDTLRSKDTEFPTSEYF